MWQTNKNVVRYLVSDELAMGMWHVFRYFRAKDRPNLGDIRGYY